MISQELLTSEYLRQIMDYDPETGIFIRKKSWTRSDLIGTVAGSFGSNGYWDIHIEGKTFRAHRLAWLFIYGEWPTNDVDHIDGNRLNNRINNLRIANRSQNNANTRSRRQLKGAFFHKGSSRWIAQIKKDGRCKYLGLFDTEEEAHAAYMQAAQLLFGEFASARTVQVNSDNNPKTRPEVRTAPPIIIEKRASVLSVEFVRSILAYDADTGLLYWRERHDVHECWNRRFAGKVTGTRGKDGLLICIHNRSYRAHRIIWFLMTGEWPRHLIDHQDGNPFNNKWENLRLASPEQNQHNRKKQRNNTSGLKDIFLSRGKWRVRINNRNKKVNIGTFDTLDAAYAAYKIAVVKLHGEFAREA